MRIIVISDTHSMHEELELPKGDMLIHAGDLTAQGFEAEVVLFSRWMRDLDYKHKIVIAGNHDWYFQKNEIGRDDFDFIYLQDSSVTIDGIKIYGSPWQPYFFNWAFNLKRGDQLKVKWSLIPRNTDILITHGPPAGYLDKCIDNRIVGCDDLLKRVLEVKPKYHIFGHIHEAYGQYKNVHSGINFINACVLNERYELINKPIIIDI